MRAPCVWAIATMIIGFGCGRPASNFDTARNSGSTRIHRVLAGGTRVAEVVDSNRIRVLASNYGGVHLGQCTDALGNPLPTTCRRPSSTSDFLSGYVDDRGYSLRSIRTEDLSDDPNHRNQLVPTAHSIYVDPSDLTRGDTRMYMRTLDVDVDASFSVGPGSSSNRTRAHRYEVIEEWSRYRNVEFERADSNASFVPPYVASADYGFAVRMVMVVEVVSSESEVNVAMGIANLDAALATNRSQISVSYEVLGARVSMLPERPPRITSNEQFYAAQVEFHELIRELDAIWRAESGDTDAGVRANPRIRAQMLAYYVDGAMVGEAQSRLDRLSSRCNATFDACSRDTDRCRARLEACYEFVACRRDILMGQPSPRCDADSDELAAWSELRDVIMRGSPNPSAPTPTAPSTPPAP